MKQLKKTIVLAVFAVVMTMMTNANVKAEGVVEFTKNITLGTTFDDKLSTGDGKYNIVVPRSGTLTVQMGVYEGSGYSWGYHGGATLYDDTGREVKSLGVNDGTDGTDTAVFTADILAGNYYIYIDRAHGNLNYYLSTNYVNSNETVVDSLTNTHNSQANTITLPLAKTYTGHLADNSTEDVYKVKSTKHQYITFKVTNRTNGCYFNIINANNTVNQKVEIQGNAQSVKVFCPKGTYYVTISKRSTYSNVSHTGTYTIKATASKIPASSIKKVTNKRGKIMAVKFALKSTQVVDGYEIQYAKNKKCTKGRKTFDIVNTDYLKSTYELVANKKGTYYVRIRTYVEDNRGDRYYSAWSKAKKIKIKK